MGKQTTIKRGRDVDKVLARAGCEVRNGAGSHKVARLPNGQVLTYHTHGEYRPGMRCKIEKALAAAGLLAAVILALAFLAVAL